MKYLSIAGTDLYASNIVMGCMRLKSQTKAQAQTIVKTALDEGINFFDNADIYGDGLCEEIFAEAVGMSPSVREKIIVQTKCGIVRGCGYDFSRDYLVKAAEASLKRLKTEYVDLLLLHRPDQLMEPQEVAEAFAYLHSSGKVRYFGVSNHNPMQTELLKRAILSVLEIGISTPNCFITAAFLGLLTRATVRSTPKNFFASWQATRLS